MTGFGRSHYVGDHHSVTVEIRAVNHRFLEWHFRLPPEFIRLEETFKKIGKNILHRGKVDVTMTLVKEASKKNTLVVHDEAMDELYETLVKMKEKYSLSSPITYHDLLRVDETYHVEDRELDGIDTAAMAEEVYEEALQALVQFRENEGAVLEKELQAYASAIRNSVKEIEQLSPTVVTRYEEKLKQKLTELSLPEEMEPRWLQEVAILADKVDISEEISRMNAHIEGFLSVLKEDGSIGRTIEFYLQEMHREINTIGSKANHAQIAQIVVSLKAILEKMREQAQNIE